MKIDNELIQIISGFEKLTKTHVKNCMIHQGKYIIIVNKGEARKAIGPDGKTLKRVESKFGKQFKIVEFNNNMLIFIKNMLLPLKTTKIEITGEGEVTVTGHDEKTRGLMIGAKAQNLRFTEEVIKKYFPELKEIKIIG